MKLLRFLCVFAFVSLMSLSSAQADFEIQPNSYSKLDFGYQRAIEAAKSRGQDLRKIFFTGILQLDGAYDEESTQRLLGEQIQVRAVIPNNTTIVTFKASLQAIIDISALNEVLSIQSPSPVRR